ncbi:MAG: 4-hydroxybenzoate octaprenyltransferase [Alphaproteobacteria bacterium]|nr:4-hydroxybenzoate octaprenyltransferase [Alphaproteobacteria bacterium]
MTQTQKISDAVNRSWIAHLPRALVPYAQLMRLDRPIGWWLLLLPCWWGLVLGQIAAGGGLHNLWMAALFLIGAIVMRGAGCTLNDIVDRDIDAKVERTRGRPLPSGMVSVKQAILFLAAQLLVGLVVLLQFNRFTLVAAICSLAIVAIYPFMKRITYWPQVVLGLAFNWGALLGWSAVHGSIGLPAVLLYFGGVSWTLAYDTIYAHQDKDDDALIGVKSTALKFGDATAYWLVFFFGLALVLIDASFWLVSAPLPTHVGVAGAALHAAWQVTRFNCNDSARCLALFRANRAFGMIILAGLVIGTLIS